MLKRSTVSWTCVLILFFSVSLFAQDGSPTTIFLARHAEKQSDTENPDLSTDGHIRANQLIHVLGSSGIRAVYTSQYMRTHKTAEPLAAFLKLKVVEVDATKTDELVKDILAKHKGESVFVSGHSNTVPEIVTALGASIPPIEDWEYDNIYIVTIPSSGKASVTRVKYGEATK